MKSKITLIAIFDDEIMIYRNRKLHRYHGGWMRAAMVRRAIYDSGQEYKLLGRTWCEQYRIGKL
jgi:hypothetical protein